MESISLLLALVTLDYDSVTGIVTACAASTNVRLGSENVDKFTLAFITPLGSEALNVSSAPKQSTNKPT